MQHSSSAPSVPGLDVVEKWFGEWPDFHDAEVISLSLARQGTSLLRVYPYYPHKPATVDFVLEQVTDLELEDFSGQNVISSLTIESAKDQNGDDVNRIALNPSYGLAGRIEANSVRLELVPGKSPDGISRW